MGMAVVSNIQICFNVKAAVLIQIKGDKLGNWYSIGNISIVQITSKCTQRVI